MGDSPDAIRRVLAYVEGPHGELTYAQVRRDANKRRVRTPEQLERIRMQRRGRYAAAHPDAKRKRR